MPGTERRIDAGGACNLKSGVITMATEARSPGALDGQQNPLPFSDQIRLSMIQAASRGPMSSVNLAMNGFNFEGVTRNESRTW